METVLSESRQEKKKKNIMEENFDITSILEVSYEEEEKALQKRRTGTGLEAVGRKFSCKGGNEGSRETPVIQLSDESCDGEGEVILGLVPAPDWVGNRPLREGADIELAATKRMQMHGVPTKREGQKPKKQEEEDGDSEDLVIDYEDEVEDIQVKEEEELHINDVINEFEGEKAEGLSDEDQNSERQDAHGEDSNSLYMSPGSFSQEIIMEQQNQDVFGCNSCPLSFSDPVLLGKHVKIHQPRRKPFICRLCLKTDTLLANLKRHMRTHSGEKPFICNLCSKLFSTAYSLKIHMRIHTGYKPYKCNHCTRSFYQKTDLNKHSITHLKMHMSQERIPFEAENYNSSHAEVDIEPVQSPQLAVMQNVTVESLNADNIASQNNMSPSQPYNVAPELIPNSKGEVVLFQGKNGVTVTCKIPFETVMPNTAPAFNSTNPKDKQSSDMNNTPSGPVISSVISQNRNNECTTNNSHSQLPISEVGNTYIIPSEPSSLTSSQAETVNNMIYTQPSSEPFCIPMYMNGQLYYIIPTVPSQSSAGNSQPQVEPSVQSVNSQPVNLQLVNSQPVNSQKVPPQESYYAPSCIPAISNGLHSSLLSSSSPARSAQPPVVINSTPVQQEQRRILCDTCKAPVTVYTG